MTQVYRCWVSNFSENGLEEWNVSNVVNMSGMFSSCDRFNANLSKWDVSQVMDKSNLFSWTIRFCGDGLEQWNTRNVGNMNCMFCHALVFDRNLSGWDVSKVIYMPDMFYEATTFQRIGLEDGTPVT
jgi:surface protein